jgi:hypothetical protein
VRKHENELPAIALARLANPRASPRASPRAPGCTDDATDTLGRPIRRRPRSQRTMAEPMEVQQKGLGCVHNYVVTAQKPTAVTHAIVGHFTSPSDINLIVA